LAPFEAFLMRYPGFGRIARFLRNHNQNDNEDNDVNGDDTI